MNLSITSRFDAGAIEVVSCEHADSIRLKIRPDSHAAFAQWFYFRLTGGAGQACHITFENAAEAAFADGWRDYRAVASYDQVNWFRVPTRYDGKVLSIEHTPLHSSIYYAYFEPYSEQRHDALLGSLQHSPLVKLTQLGQTLQGRPLTEVTVAAVPGTGVTAAGAGVAQTTISQPLRHIWLIARQHPGETMAEWFIEGLLARLVGRDGWEGDPVARQALSMAVFHVVPNMNPDGSALGNLRTNAAGANLNREWLEPDLLRSPEVAVVRRAIEQTGCEMFFDVHGDEALPYVFVAGSEMLPQFDARQAAQQASFIEFFLQASPDFQNKFGYGTGKYREDALKLASKYIGHRYGCLSLTLELPFKDNANAPDPEVGWNGARSKALGAAMLGAILRQLQLPKPELPEATPSESIQG
jgi:murein tripeptide amidase MpaA